MKQGSKLHSFTLLIFISLIVSEAYAKKKKPNIYPFKAISENEIYADVMKISETEKIVKNFRYILTYKLSSAAAKNQPWTSSYWPLVKGTIADAYEDSKVPYYADFIRTHRYQWKATAKSFEKRYEKVLSKIDSLSEKELAKLAPSEKYDLLLGDKSFDLTRRLMSYMSEYGSNNYFQGLYNIVLAPEKGSKNDSIKYALFSMSINQNINSIEEAFEKDYVLSQRLDTKLALKLYRAGLYSSIEEAHIHALTQAQEEAKNYVLDEEPQDTIAAWEGICNGWSTASMLVPRPRKAIYFTLDDGRKLKFYPSDIKGLISQYWFNSEIQNEAIFDQSTNEKLTEGVISVGLRCNLTRVPQDDYGRLYDNKIDRYSGRLESRCSGVHPAKWYLSLINLMGVQKRSFIVERKVNAAVDNHPLVKYEFKYYNPYNGKSYKEIGSNVQFLDKDDQFYKSRHPSTYYILGVRAHVTYNNYAKPKRKNKDREKDDLLVEKKMFFDLEMDKEFNIIGGQWRAVPYGVPLDDRTIEGRHNRERSYVNHNQPDFFWVISKDWKKTGFFDDMPLEKWHNKRFSPPKSWKEAALKGVKTKSGLSKFNNYEYYHALIYGNATSCNVKNTKTDESMSALCERKYNRPLPLINVVNALIEKSK